MRLSLAKLVLGLTLLIASTACTSTVTGVGLSPRSANPTANVRVTPDRFGIELGAPDAPARVDVFIEPQCPHCGEFERRFSAEMARDVAAGRLAVTYRPVTFRDLRTRDYSARVSNALFLAAGPDAATSAPSIFAFIDALYVRLGPDGTTLTDNPGIADIAESSGVAPDVAELIAAGQPGVDAKAMDDANGVSLENADPESPSTPTVFDTIVGELVDTTDPEWVAHLAKFA